jgi:hypothetical protein
MHISQFGMSGCPVSIPWGITEAGTPFPRNFTPLSAVPPPSAQPTFSLARNVPPQKPDSQAKRPTERSPHSVA